MTTADGREFDVVHEVSDEGTKGDVRYEFYGRPVVSSGGFFGDSTSRRSGVPLMEISGTRLLRTDEEYEVQDSRSEVVGRVKLSEVVGYKIVRK